ncbi:queuosine precursor transporter [Thalassospira xianhensis]|uniref:Probable queuosine precursor transporter n=1 Tax=Thalassospira xianhensis MCCC 1A02616 TaxID=1177929 RepID=A0A367U9W5_9PROT|nr:queuosine precursor transporter [Thalassospira xianhensis]RCK03832.1 membrane protein [Thalassospira xianhensis MCCC 1A02616]
MKAIIIGVLAMAVTVVASNILVEYPLPGVLADWLTYGAFTYPVAFLVTDLTNRARGAAAARLVVLAGFAIAVVLSLIVADTRIAIASGTAFLIAQMLDVTVFDKLRRATWWKAPLISSGIGSAVDTALFFSIAFVGTGLPWQTWAMGDFTAKVIMALTCLAPFRLLMTIITPRMNAEPVQG